MQFRSSPPITRIKIWGFFEWTSRNYCDCLRKGDGCLGIRRSGRFLFLRRTRTSNHGNTCPPDAVLSLAGCSDIPSSFVPVCLFQWHDKWKYTDLNCRFELDSAPIEDRLSTKNPGLDFHKAIAG